MSFTFSICHPTARVDSDAPLFWAHSMLSFLERCDRPEDIEYILVVHKSNKKQFDESFAQWFGRLPQSWWGSFHVRINGGANTGRAQGDVANAAATGDILIGSMDDLFPPEHWDSLILSTLGLHAIDKPLVLHVSSGSPSDGDLFIPQILTAARYRQFGYVCHPSYQSMYADNEFTEVARRDGVVIEAPHIVFEHRHPCFGSANMDAVYAQENSAEAYTYGLKNLIARRAAGFPKDPAWRMTPTDETEATKVLGMRETDGPVAPLPVAVCLPGENFPAEVMGGAIGLLLYMVTHNYHPMPLMGYTSNVHCTRIEFTNSVLSFVPKPEFVYWGDDDNIIMADQFEMLMQTLQEHPEVAGVVGWCWCDNDGKDPDKPWMMSCGMYTGEGMGIRRFTAEDLERAGGPVIPCDWSGFPAVLLRTSAMEQLGARAFVPIVGETVNEKFGFASEDASWFWRAHEAGMKFLVDLRVKVPHLKRRAIEPQFVPKPKQEEVLEVAMR